MKRFIFAVLVALIALPVFAQDAAAPAPAADAAAPAAALVKVEGKIVVTKAEGQPDVVTVKTADAELTLLPCDKLTELLAVEGLADKTFVLEGEKVPAKDGKSEGFMVKSFEEKKADAPAAPETK
ncbi:MAG: hypothetical protein GX442_23550 [Candidatus Riflebacteria bacterium]|nr:hypothetical protein [Candidatus Riflebacteria bacterium]